jgi:hypothetical protein
MYYKEEIINGILMFRNTPKGEWRQCSVEKMGQKIMDLEDEITALHQEMAGADV